MLSYEYISFKVDWLIVSGQLYFTINLEEIFYFNNKKCRIYAALGVSQTPKIISPRKENENMSTATKQAIDLMELLPESEQNFALEFIKKLVIAWDPDFTKVTPTERAELERAQREIENGETVSHDAINWD